MKYVSIGSCGLPVVESSQTGRPEGQLAEVLHE
jgi:hypothetical protein